MRHLARAAVLAVAALTLAACVSRTGPKAAEETSTIPPITGFDDPAEPSRPADGCDFERKSGEEAPVGLPPGEKATDSRTIALNTNRGALPIRLEPGKAPCTVHSFAFLAAEGFFDGTECHRLTASAGLKVLQCGDPNGDGTGGPGYTIPDELPTGLPPGAPGPDGGKTVIYQRGVVAMANAGPDTGGSQFFLVYGDSTLPPSYTVFGELDATGLDTLDTIASGGVVPGPYGPEDGTPKLRVTIESATVG